MTSSVHHSFRFKPSNAYEDLQIEKAKNDTNTETQQNKSAIIVSYRDPGYIEENVKKLIHNGFEIIIAVDEPNEEILRIIKEYNLKHTVSNKRRGKWRALNDALALAEGHHILFIDSDTKILRLNYRYEFDAVDIVKEIEGSSLLERLVNIEYFNMFLTAKIASKFGTCLSLNGAAFGIKKDVLLNLGGFRKRINEDTDLGVRLGLKGYRFGVCGKATTKAPTTFKSWFSQRERWSLGGAEVVVEHIGSILKRPKLWIPYLFLFYPSVIGFILNFSLSDNLIIKILSIILPFLFFLNFKAISLLLLFLFEVHIIKHVIVALIAFIVWASIEIFLSKKYKYKIDFKLLPIYYFVYVPLWTMISIVALAKVLIYRILGKKLKVKNWVV